MRVYLQSSGYQGFSFRKPSLREHCRTMPGKRSSQLIPLALTSRCVWIHLCKSGIHVCEVCVCTVTQSKAATNGKG